MLFRSKPVRINLQHDDEEDQGRGEQAKRSSGSNTRSGANRLSFMNRIRKKSFIDSSDDDQHSVSRTDRVRILRQSPVKRPKAGSPIKKPRSGRHRVSLIGSVRKRSLINTTEKGDISFSKPEKGTLIKGSPSIKPRSSRNRQSLMSRKQTPFERQESEGSSVSRPEKRPSIKRSSMSKARSGRKRPRS